MSSSGGVSDTSAKGFAQSGRTPAAPAKRGASLPVSAASNFSSFLPAFIEQPVDAGSRDQAGALCVNPVGRGTLKRR